MWCELKPIKCPGKCKDKCLMLNKKTDNNLDNAIIYIQNKK